MNKNILYFYQVLIMLLLCTFTFPNVCKCQNATRITLDKKKAKDYLEESFKCFNSLDSLPPSITKSLKKEIIFLTDKEEYYNPTGIHTRTPGEGDLVSKLGVSRKPGLFFVLYKGYNYREGLMIFDYTDKKTPKIFVTIEYRSDYEEVVKPFKELCE